MKFHFFHLMPYPELPEDFRENQSLGLGRCAAPSCSIPRSATAPTTTISTSSNTPASVGFDGICVNEHHQNAYGLMPSPNLMAAALARRTSGVKLVLMGNSVALYNPPTRVAEEMAMLDVLSRRAARRRLPGRHADGHDLLLRPVAGDAAREIPRGRRSHPARLERARRVLVQRQVHPASLRQHLAAADAEAAAAGLGAGRRQRRDLGPVPGEGFPLRQPVLLRLPGRPEDHGRLLERGRSPQSAAQSIPRGLPAIHRGRRQRRRGRAALRRAGAVFLPALPARLCGLCESAGLHVDGDPAGRHRGPGRRASPTAPARAPKWRRCRGRT